MRRNEGFTLVELLIVLAVIAALLATITPVALNAVKKAKATQVAENLRNIKTAIEQYVYVQQATPSGIASLVEAHYLSANPGDDYAATVGGWDDKGTALATIAYKGHDVDADKVNQIFPEATKATADESYVHSGDIYIDFTVAKYW